VTAIIIVNNNNNEKIRKKNVTHTNKEKKEDIFLKSVSRNKNTHTNNKRKV